MAAAPFVGNNDFRGYLNYLASNGDQTAGLLIGQGTGGTGYINNTGQLSGTLPSAFDTPTGSTIPGSQNEAAARAYAANAYQTWQGLQSGGAAPASGSGVDNSAVIGQLQGQLGQLDPQQQVGLDNIGNSFNLSANRLDEQNAAAQRDYGTKTQQNLQGYQNNRSNILQGTRAQANALQRLLGLNGAGNSSAAYEQAPYAAALAGSQQLNGAQQTFGQNGTSLDTAWQDTERNYGNSKQDLQNQRYQQENALRSSIAQTKASLLNNIAQAQNSPGKYSADINGLLSQITQLGQQYSNPVMRTPDVSFAAPSLTDYILKNTGQTPGAPAPQAAGGAQSDVSPTFLGLLTGQNRDEFGNLVSA